MTYPFKNLVFEGGGVKGIAYVGAMEILEAEGILERITRIGGTSVGAINAVLLAAGYTNDEMSEILWNLDFNQFKDASFGAFRNLWRVTSEYGWFKGDAFLEWVEGLVQAKTGQARITFKQLQAHTHKDLFVYASNLSTGFGEVYSPEHTPNMSVSDAVRRSLSIPLFFRANQRNEDVFVDGGVINNYPVKMFDREKFLDNPDLIRTPDYYPAINERLKTTSPTSSPYIYNKETLGFRLDSQNEIGIFKDGEPPACTPINNFLDYSVQLVKTLLAVQDTQHLHSDDWHRTLYIDTLGVGAIDFDVNEKMKMALVESGKHAAREYLKWWSNTDSDLAINHPNSTA